MTERSSRFLTGVGWGIVATATMSAVMLIGMRTGLSPMPKPIPAAIVGRLGGSGLPEPAMMALAGLAHLAYGGFWGGALAALVREVSLKAGLVLGFVLWLVMQVVVLPVLGWGLFGVSVAPAIAGATLVLHLVYGGVLGGLLERASTPSSAARSGAEGAA